MTRKIIKIFLRLAIGSSFLSAVADRFGWWGETVSVWGNWNSFLEYTQVINPWFPESFIPVIGMVATAAEIVLGIFLILGIKTELMAKWSGFLLLLFAFSMTFSIGLKAPLDYSAYTASAGAFALSLMTEKYLEFDCVMTSRRELNGNL